MVCFGYLVLVSLLSVVCFNQSFGLPISNTDVAYYGGLNDHHDIARSRVIRDIDSSRTIGGDAAGMANGRFGMASSGAAGAYAGGHADGKLRAQGGAEGGFNLGLDLFRGLTLGGHGKTYGGVETSGNANGYGSSYAHGQTSANTAGEAKAKSGLLFGFLSRSFDDSEDDMSLESTPDDNIIEIMPDESASMNRQYNNQYYDGYETYNNYYMQRPNSKYSSLPFVSHYNMYD